MKQRESGVYDAISPKQQPLSNFRYSQRIRGVEIGLKEATIDYDDLEHNQDSLEEGRVLGVSHAD